MRPQQNRRMRGRGNNNNNPNRKGPNPLTRSYESNGPDVKIRGTAQQIADKYATLARDAQSSGDRVMAENYLQHAEHYNRIIAAALAQLPSQTEQQQRDRNEDEDDEFERDGQQHSRPEQNPQNGRHEASQQPANQQRMNGHQGAGPQPVIEGVPAEVALREQPQQPRGEPAEGEESQAAEAGSEGDQQPRRQRRPRRPRAPRSQQDGQPSEEAPAQEEAAQ